jgi:hypothetical protein
MEVNGQVHASAALSPGKRPPALLDRRLDRPHSRSGRCGGEKNVIIRNDENRRWNACQSVDILTSETTQNGVLLA